MAQQLEVAGTERTALGKAAQAFIDKKQDIENEQATLETLGEKIIEEMGKEKRRTFKFNSNGKPYEFAIIDVGEKLRCLSRPVSKR